MLETPNLSFKYLPQPKPMRKINLPKPMVKIGKKMKTDAEIRKENIVRFYKIGITSCEIKMEGCWKNNALSFAHLEKRRKLTEDDLRVVVLACIPCHSIVEQWFAGRMKKFLTEIINSRKVQP